MICVYVLCEVTHGHLVRSETRSSYVSEVETARGPMLIGSPGHQTRVTLWMSCDRDGAREL